MAINISGIQQFTDAELLILSRMGIAHSLAGQSRNLGDGRSYTFPSPEQMWLNIEKLESRINAANGEGGIAEVQFEDQSVSTD